MHFFTVILMQFCSTLLMQENYARLVRFLCTHACILQLLKLHCSSVILMQFCSTLMPQENYSSLEQFLSTHACICLFQEYLRLQFECNSATICCCNFISAETKIKAETDHACASQSYMRQTVLPG